MPHMVFSRPQMLTTAAWLLEDVQAETEGRAELVFDLQVYFL
jgi:hypothetical protein